MSNQPCDHPWHRNPALIMPCPACAEGAEPDSPPPRPASEVVETDPKRNVIKSDTELRLIERSMAKRGVVTANDEDLLDLFATIRVLRGWPQRKEGVKP